MIVDPRVVGAWSWDEQLCGFIDVVDPKGRWGLILGWTIVWICWCCWSKGPLGLDLRMNSYVDLVMLLIQKGCRGLILGWTVVWICWTLSSRAVEAWSWIGGSSSRAVRAWSWRRNFFKGRWGLILKEDLTKNEEGFLDPSGFAWELQSFEASRLWCGVNSLPIWE